MIYKNLLIKFIIIINFIIFIKDWMEIEDCNLGSLKSFIWYFSLWNGKNFLILKRVKTLRLC